ncbi:MAG TPA: hypothetical protein VGR10_07390, partial [Thermoleophilaceae bacterium]|nr:hypothetical protein [Thermoleophilaceae bacterium]
VRAHPPAGPTGERRPGRLRRLSEPRPVRLGAGRDGVPVSLAGVPVEAVLEDWVVEDRWWTGRPLRRRHFELVLENGRNVVVFRDLVAGAWYVQRS